MAADSPDHLQETRRRVLETAGRLFAERGFNNVTVRSICREAGANLAAVNYHFRDKLGLYKEVVQLAAERMRSAKHDAMQAGEGLSPEQQLRTYIRVFLHHLLGEEKEDSWIDKLVARELADPTPALDLIIEHGIKPNAARLVALVSQLLGCSPEDERARHCATSIQGQCVFHRHTKAVAARWSPDFMYTPEVIDGLADHIAEFSLAGIRAIAQQRQEVRQ